MSFASQVKTELCSVRASACCSKAQCYGMLLFAKRFSVACISLQTENIEVADMFSRLCGECFNVRTRITQGGVKRDTYLVSVISPYDRKKIMLSYGAVDGKRPDTINSDIIKKECCKAAFIRGAFISCGGLSDPNKAYHAKFVIKDKFLANDFYVILCKSGLTPKTYISKNSVHLYYKDSRLIEDLLTKINATKNTLAVMDMGIIKTVKNKLNRQENCMMANLDKTVEASVKQRNAIKILRRKGILETLGEEMCDIAALREEYPDSSLSELCGYYSQPITKSALTRRLNKLVELAGETEGEK